MKKIVKFLFGIASFGLCTFYGNAQTLKCGTYSDFDAKFKNLGALHNAHLTNIVQNFTIPANIDSKEAAVEAIKEFNRKFYVKNALQYTTVAPDAAIVNEGFELSKELVNEMAFKEILVSNKNQFSLENVKSTVSTLPIDGANKQILIEISDLMTGCSKSEISDVQLEAALANLADRWLVKNANNPTPDDELTGSMLAIGLKSCEWWKENPVAKNFKDEVNDMIQLSGPNSQQIEFAALPVWPFLDAAGALVGGVVGSANQLINNGSVNWGQTGTAVVTGAVTGSTGVVGRIGRWFRSLF